VKLVTSVLLIFKLLIIALKAWIRETTLSPHDEKDPTEKHN